MCEERWVKVGRILQGNVTAEEAKRAHHTMDRNIVKEDKTVTVNFDIDSEALTETATKRITGMKLVIEYENPQAYGYPEVCHWSKEYEFDVDKMRKNKGENL
jgi:hypothetical protein